MKDWEAYKLITELIDNLQHSSPVGLSFDAADAWYDATKAAEKQLKEARQPFADRLYAVYVEHKSNPWCDTCGKQVVLREPFGWYHVGEMLTDHEVTLKEYHWGSEVELQKRL